MVGFNRRFSPALQRAKAILKNRSTPIIVNYRMNAGFIPLDHWVHGPEGGGRNIGEACHIYDLFNFLTDSTVEKVEAVAIKPSGKQWAKNDNFVATIRYQDGSICTLTYTSLGAKEYPKERMDIFADGLVITMDDYKRLEVAGSTQKGWSANSVQKGHMEELQSLGQSLLQGGAWPISYDQLRQATMISFKVENQLY